MLCYENKKNHMLALICRFGKWIELHIRIWQIHNIIKIYDES